MKRMDEVFRLPIDANKRAYDDDAFFWFEENSAWCATFGDDEQAKSAAHAINHVDELADALEMMINFTSSFGSHSDSIRAAKKALAAYRGEK